MSLPTRERLEADVADVGTLRVLLEQDAIRRATGADGHHLRFLSCR